jgi:hypothetical protein
MRYRFMATYLGVPYHVGLGPDGTEVTLFSPGPPPEDLGFTRLAGYWRKKVSIGEITALWQSRLVGEYRGERCLVLDDLGDRLHIAFLGRDTARARQLGYWEIDREVFEVVVIRQEVIGLTEERLDFPLTAATFPPSGGFPPSGPFSVSSTGPFPVASTGPFPVSSTGPFPVAGPSSVAGPSPASGPSLAEQTAPQPAFTDQVRYDRVDRPAPMPAPPPPPPAPVSSSPSPLSPDRAAAWHGSPAPDPWPPPVPGPVAPPAGAPVAAPVAAPPMGRRTGRRDRVSPQSVFAELLTLAGIPHTAYAVDEEVSGAMCVFKVDGGFEVFSSTDDARLDVRFFEDEEAAYFYLFGVLVAEAVRSGRLGPLGPLGPMEPLGPMPNGYRNGSRPSATGETISNYLRCRKLPKLLLSPARVYLAGGADGPPLPKQPRRPPRPP